MIKKVIMVLAILALVASAGTVPAGGHYKITLERPAIVKGTVLKAGDYKVTLGDAKVTISTDSGKNPIEVPAKLESVEKKFSETVVGYVTENGKQTLTEIRLGGTTTKVVFDR
ncbi:MAG: hypothetical protein ABSB88_11625 [Bryobacteraceae bacterium]|jgi:acyl CoA:acetate/3-ketoacid CoA transferase